MSKSVFDSLLAQLGALTGISDLFADEDGYCLVQVDGYLDVSIEYDEERNLVTISAALGRLPEPLSTSLLAELLQANYYWVGTGGGSLALNGLNKSLHLQFRESLERMDGERLNSLLEAIVINAELWYRRLQQATATSTPGQTADSNGQATPADWLQLRA